MVYHEYATEYHHLDQHAAEQQIGSSSKQIYFGYISQYDAVTGFVTVLNPSNRTAPSAAFPNGQAQISAPMPLGSFMVPTAMPGSANYGLRYHPFGGSQATANPADETRGEQVLVMSPNPGIGYSGGALLTWNNFARLGKIPVSNLQTQPGELVVITPAGTVIHLDADGNQHTFLQQVQPLIGPPVGGNQLTMVNGGISLNTGPPNTLPPIPSVGDIDINSANAINETSGLGITIKSLNGNILLEAPAGQIVGTAETLVEFESNDEINLVAQGDAFIQGKTSVNVISDTVAFVNAPLVNIISATTDIVETSNRDLDEVIARDINANAGRNVNTTATGNIVDLAANINPTALTAINESAPTINMTASLAINAGGVNAVNINTGATGVVAISGGGSTGGAITEAADTLTDISATLSSYTSLKSLWIGTRPMGTGTPQDQTIQITNNPSNHPALSARNITIDGRAGSTMGGFDGEVDIYADSHIQIQAQNSNNTGFMEIQANSAIQAGCNNGTSTGDFDMEMSVPSLTGAINSPSGSALMTLAPNGTSGMSQQYGSGPISQVELQANIAGATLGASTISGTNQAQLILSVLPHAELNSDDGTNVADLDLDSSHAQLSFAVTGGGSGGVTVTEDALQAISGTSNFVLLQGTGTTNFPVAIYVGAGVDHMHFQALLTDAFRAAFNAHTHGGVSTGSSNTGVPTSIIAANGTFGGKPIETVLLQAN